MFEDSLVESAGKIRTNTRWTGLVSLIVQSVVVGFLILIPLIYTDVLPTRLLATALTAPPPPPPPPPPPTPQIQHVQRVSEIINGELRTPNKIPKKIQMIKEEEAPPPPSNVTGVMGGVPGGVPGGVMNSLVGPATAPPPKVATPQKVRISEGVSTGLLKNRVEPTYPQMAKIAHLSGDVVLQAIISKDGSIENLRAVSGHPILVTAALDAVKQWRYQPYKLNGEPVEVETTITVRFHM